MHLPTRPLTLLPAALLAASLAAPATVAQQPSPATPPPAPPPASAQAGRASTPASAQVGGPLLSVEFAGGTLGQFVDAVKGACREPINVIVPAEASHVPVPPLSLKSVSALMALQSLEYINDRGGANVKQGLPSLKIAHLNYESGNNAASGGAPTFAVAVMRMGGSQPLSPFSASDLITRVYSVAELLPSAGASGMPGLSLDQIVQPVETTLTVDSGDNPAPEDGPKVMVHRESNLIIVRGTSRQADLAKQVIDRLREDVELLRGRVLPERELERTIVEVTQQRKMEVLAAQRFLSSASQRVAATESDMKRLLEEHPETSQPVASARRSIEDARRMLANAIESFERSQAQKGDEEIVARKLLAERSRLGAASVEVRQLREQIEELRRNIQELRSTQGR